MPQSDGGDPIAPMDDHRATQVELESIRRNLGHKDLHQIYLGTEPEYQMLASHLPLQNNHLIANIRAPSKALILRIPNL